MSVQSYIQCKFERCSLSHPDRELISLILLNMKHGFRINYQGDTSGMPVVRNRINKEDFNKVSIKVLEEVRAGRFAGPFPSPPFAHMRFSPLQAVPKMAMTSACSSISPLLMMILSIHMKRNT